MPFYSYQCEKHGEFELQSTLSNYQEQEVCPVCGGRSQRVFYAPIYHMAATEDVKASQAHVNDIKSRYNRPDGTVGRKGDKFYKATMQDIAKGKK